MRGESGIEIPHTHLTRDVVRRLAEEFVTREGTDYGRVEKTLEQKVTALIRQIERGEARILYDRDSETTNIVLTGG